MGQFLRHVEHNDNKCLSSDALALYEQDDGSVTGYCWSCHTFVPSEKLEEYNDGGNIIRMNQHHLSVKEINDLPSLAIPERGITQEVADRYHVKTEIDEKTGKPVAWYLPRTRGGKLVGWKKRWAKPESHKKRYINVGDAKDCDMFGQAFLGEKGKWLILTEGEFDALAASTMFGMKGKNYRVASLQDGASANSVQKNLEWIDGFDEIILCLDQDDDGKKAASEIANFLSHKTVKVVEFSEKDANDMLKAGKVDQFWAAVNNAKKQAVDGIVEGDSTWDIVKNKPEVSYILYPEDWAGINQMTYGIRLGELDTWTSGSGAGKTQIMRQIKWHLLKNTDAVIGDIALEEPLVDTVEGLMSLEMRKRIHLPDVRETLNEEELYEAWSRTAGTGRIHFYDHFGSVDDASILSKIRYLAQGMGCKYIFLDHLSIVVSEFAAEGDERKKIDQLMSRLKKLTQELNIWIGLVVHLRKNGVNDGPSFEEGAVPSLDDLRGSGSIKQLSNSVYAIARNQQHADRIVRNTSSLHVLKCRFTGRTGLAGFLYYNDETGHMEGTVDPRGNDG